MPPIKSTKYISSKVKNKSVINNSFVTCYFENIPYIGDLALEHIFYEYGEPVLFVCRGINNKRYLCSCCKLSEKWILSQVSEEELIQLINDSISIRSLFEPRVQSPFMLSLDGVSLSAKFDNIMPELLPDAKPLELPKKETDEYREFLVDQLSSKKPKEHYCCKRNNIDF